MAIIPMKSLLEAGVHFGHQTKDGILEWLHIYSQLEMEYIF